VLASKKKAAWSENGSIIRHVFAGRAQLSLGKVNGVKTFGQRYCEVIYEQLVDHPEEAVREICERLNLSFSPAMLEFAAAAQNLVAEDEKPWKLATLGFLEKNNVGKWSVELNDFEVSLVEFANYRLFTTYGYRKSGRHKSLAVRSRIKLFMALGLIVVGDPLYRVYRKASDLRAGRYA
jgi:hypothetical protein